MAASSYSLKGSYNMMGRVSQSVDGSIWGILYASFLFLLPSFLLTMLVRTVPRNSVGSWGTMASRERKSRSPSRRMLTPSMAMAQGGIVASGSTSR